MATICQYRPFLESSARRPGATLATWSNLNHANGYVVHTANMTPYIGQTVVVKFLGVEDVSLQTSFVLDDVTLTVQ